MNSFTKCFVGRSWQCSSRQIPGPRLLRLVALPCPLASESAPVLYIQLADAERESRVRVGFMGQTCTWHTSRPPRKARKRDLAVGLKEKGNDMVESQPGTATRDQTQSVTVLVGV